MSGITSGVGLFSGLDTATIISQLLQIEARPRTLAQQRIVQLQGQQAALLDINSRMGSLKTAASAFRTQNTFGSMRAASSDPEALTATASTNAAPGSYTFVVDRLVSTQQMMSRGFADADTSAIGADQFTIETIAGRLDRESALADFNGGTGVERGNIVLTQTTGGSSSVTIDLSRAVTAQDVLDAINSNGVVDVTASVEDGHFVITHDSGESFTIGNATGYNTASSLGIASAVASSTVTGSDVYYLADTTPLSAINDGNGVDIGNTVSDTAHDFRIRVDFGGPNEEIINVNIGEKYINGELQEGATTTLGGVIDRINEAIADSDDYAGQITAQINAAGTGIQLVNTTGEDIQIVENNGTTAADLGFQTGVDISGDVDGAKIYAGINSTLTKFLNGGDGVAGDGTLDITARDGSNAVISFNTDSSVNEIIAAINDQGSGIGISASLNSQGTGILITDSSGGGGNLIVAQNDTADSLGLTTDPGGVAEDSLSSGNLQHAYIRESTLVSGLRGGKGIGTGTIRITDSQGATANLEIGTDTRTIGDFISEFNSRGLNAKARINDSGDGIEIYEDPTASGYPGAVKIKIEDASGSVAKNLRILGEAEGVDADNTIDGSFERVIEFDVGDTLDDMVEKINNANAGVSVSIINDGSGSTPYRLSFTSLTTGTEGRFILDTGNLDLALNTLDQGEDSLVFFGGTDPASAILLSGSTNTLDSVIRGVSIDLQSASDDPVTLTVTQNTSAIETKIDEFINAFNQVVQRMDFQTRVDPETEVRGPLAGDSTLRGLRTAMFNTVLGPVDGVTGTFTRLSQVGVTVGDGGLLTFDQDEFREAMTRDPEAVEAIFAEYELVPKEPVEVGPDIFLNNTDGPDEFESIGVLGQLEQLVGFYTDSIDGVFKRREEALSNQIDLQQDRVEFFTEQLTRKRSALERQFIAMEQAIAQLQQQQSALAGLR